MDWEQGVWRSHDYERATHRVIVGGDWCPRRELAEVAVADPLLLYGDLLPDLQSADLRIVNLEGPLTRRAAPMAKEGPVLRLDPETSAGLSAVPFDLACLANNHVMDHGATGLRDTLGALAERGIGSVGAGMTPEEARAVVVQEVGGVRVGVVNFCEGEDGTGAVDGPGTFGWEPDRMVLAVARHRAEVDVLMVVAHAGREHVPVPPPYVQRLYRSIAEAGADLVVGHHPHVPQGVEIHGGVPIVYSLGNFVMYDRWGPALRRRGLLLSVGIRDGAVAGLRLIPYVVGEAGVRRPQEPERRWLLDQLRIASGVLDDPDRVREVWHAFIDRAGEASWRNQLMRTRSFKGAVAARLGLARSRRSEQRLAVVLRNRYGTPAHRHYLADGLARLSAGELGSAPPWARELVAVWLDLDEAGLERATG